MSAIHYIKLFLLLVFTNSKGCYCALLSTLQLIVQATFISLLIIITLSPAKDLAQLKGGHKLLALYTQHKQHICLVTALYTQHEQHICLVTTLYFIVFSLIQWACNIAR